MVGYAGQAVPAAPGVTQIKMLVRSMRSELGVSQATLAEIFGERDANLFAPSRLARRGHAARLIAALQPAKVARLADAVGFERRYIEERWTTPIRRLASGETLNTSPVEASSHDADAIYSLLESSIRRYDAGTLDDAEIKKLHRWFDAISCDTGPIESSAIAGLVSGLARRLNEYASFKGEANAPDDALVDRIDPLLNDLVSFPDDALEYALYLNSVAIRRRHENAVVLATSEKAIPAYSILLQTVADHQWVLDLLSCVPKKGPAERNLLISDLTVRAMRDMSYPLVTLSISGSRTGLYENAVGLLDQATGLISSGRSVPDEHVDAWILTMATLVEMHAAVGDTSSAQAAWKRVACRLDRTTNAEVLSKARLTELMLLAARAARLAGNRPLYSETLFDEYHKKLGLYKADFPQFADRVRRAESIGAMLKSRNVNALWKQYIL
ncbi:MAG: hypothetical protein P4L33_10625 [Capsulimonadaceae bacterium]|nr:hypothetical protein [Capsulimonadaceae bacterium]